MYLLVSRTNLTSCHDNGILLKEDETTHQKLHIRHSGKKTLFLPRWAASWVSLSSQCLDWNLTSPSKAVLFLDVFHLGNNLKAPLCTSSLNCTRMYQDTLILPWHPCLWTEQTESSQGWEGRAPPPRPSACPGHPESLGRPHDQRPPPTPQAPPPPRRPASSMRTPTWPLPARPLKP